MFKTQNTAHDIHIQKNHAWFPHNIPMILACSYIFHRSPLCSELHHPIFTQRPCPRPMVTMAPVPASVGPRLTWFARGRWNSRHQLTLGFSYLVAGNIWKNPETIERMGYTYGLIYMGIVWKKGIEKSLWDSQYLDEPMDMSWLRRKFMRLLDGRHRPSQFWPKNWVHPKTHPATNGDVYFSTSQISQVWIASPLFCWT